MNTDSAHEYTMFAPAKLLHKWGEQWPSNQGNLDSSVTGEFGRVNFTAKRPASNFVFVSQCVIVVGLCFKWYTLYMCFVNVN
jgi:hypothetical protein